MVDKQLNCGLIFRGLEDLGRLDLIALFDQLLAKLGGEELFILSEDEILAVVE